MRRATLALLGAVGAAAAGGGPASAETIRVAAGSDLAAVLGVAPPGAALVLEPGRHPGPLVIGRPLTLSGVAGARVDGSGRGSVITVTAPDVKIAGLIIAGSGADLAAMDSGVFLARTARRSRVLGNRIEGNLFGVYIHGAADTLVQGNTILGRTGGRRSETGNGVSVWNAPGAAVIGNRIAHGRDGIFVVTSRRNRFVGNRFEGVRFGVHYMYADDGEVADNVVVGSHVALAIMFSSRLTIRGNWSIGSRDHGLLFNFANQAEIADNLVVPAASAPAVAATGPADAHLPDAARDPDLSGWPGTGKCVFIFNTNNNRFTGNRFEGCAIGIHFTAGSEGNRISGNAFVANRTQVKYVGSRFLDWSVDRRGNAWSDHPAFDLDRDGIADEPYRPNDIIDRVVWTYPAAMLLLNSPAVQLVRWSQKQFPALAPGGVVDPWPLMRPPPRPAVPPPPVTP